MKSSVLRQFHRLTSAKDLLQKKSRVLSKLHRLTSAMGKLREKRRFYCILYVEQGLWVSYRKDMCS
jgi:hypothetical protein